MSSSTLGYNIVLRLGEYGDNSGSGVAYCLKSGAEGVLDALSGPGVLCGLIALCGAGDASGLFP